MDIIALGEVLIDLTQTGLEGTVLQFAAFPGGAPANVAVAAARLGARTGFIGKVGADAFGNALRPATVWIPPGCMRRRRRLPRWRW